MPRLQSLIVTMRLSLIFALVALLSSAAPALAERRVALVIGNSEYHSVPRLENPANDAKLVARTLRGLGFALVGDDAQVDLDKAHFDSALQAFGNQVLGADVALFYYAGHGLQVAGKNFLVPVEANPTKEADVYLQMIDTSIVLSQMEGSGTKLNIVLLDACRNNPFGGRGLRAAGGGLAQMLAPEGTLISYATQPGNIALDGSDGDSPYTKALVATMTRPGLGLFDTFNAVGLAVKQATGGQQQPWLSSSPIEGGFAFVGSSQVAAAEAPATAPLAGAPAQGAEAAPRTARAPAALPTPDSKPPTAEPASPPTAAKEQTAALNPQAQPAAATDAATAIAACDRLAASPIDPTRTAGVVGLEFDEMDAAAAVPACRAALAAEPDNPRLQFELGRAEMKAGGAGEEVLGLFRKAAMAGSAAAMNGLGLAYDRGIGAPRDMSEALRWYRQSADAGNRAAMRRLGVVYKKGEGVEKDQVQAAAWFRKSADAGDVVAMTDIGLAYLNGWGVRRDPREAVNWFRKGADGGGPASMNHLALCYLYGQGVARDPAEAVRWFRKAADAGNAKAMESLGDAYRNGVGVKKDEDESQRWYAKAHQ
jgi:TPR repeat protein